MFVGYCPEHASTVGHILNLTTGAISPQYHVAYDELFSSVANAGVNMDEFSPEMWNQLLHSGVENLLNPADLPEHGERKPLLFLKNYILSSSNPTMEPSEIALIPGEMTISNLPLPLKMREPLMREKAF